MGATYDYDFYKDRHQRTNYSAQQVLSILADVLPSLKSAVDFGCGVGTWLSVAQNMGAANIKGLDGPWVDHKLLEIPLDNFEQVNFEENIECDQRYDLAITLEVAEHLAGKTAGKFVESLIRASDFVLFSAAIPYQGGEGHINEQWPDYWVEQFQDKGYVALDCIRKEIWSDRKIPIWYRQNILLFVKQERLEDLKLPGIDVLDLYAPLSTVHPETYLHMVSLRGSFSLFLKAVGKRFSELF